LKKELSLFVEDKNMDSPVDQCGVTMAFFSRGCPHDVSLFIDNVKKLFHPSIEG